MNIGIKILQTGFLIFFTLLGLPHANPKVDLQSIETSFITPPADCWPHTRWWWPGNAVTKAEITWELEQMKKAGILGVEQITMPPVYEKGNIPF